MTSGEFCYHLAVLRRVLPPTGALLFLGGAMCTGSQWAMLNNCSWSSVVQGQDFPPAALC
jgi:hypothetical protein